MEAAVISAAVCNIVEFRIVIKEYCLKPPERICVGKQMFHFVQFVPCKIFRQFNLIKMQLQYRMPFNLKREQDYK